MPDDKFDSIINALNNGIQPQNPNSSNEGLATLNEGLSITKYSKTQSANTEKRNGSKP